MILTALSLTVTVHLYTFYAAEYFDVVIFKPSMIFTTLSLTSTVHFWTFYAAEHFDM